METYTLKRTGKRAIRFEGELVAERSSKVGIGPGNDRWHEFHLYRTADGHFYLSVTSDSLWQGEERNVRIRRIRSLESLIEFVRDEYDPFRFTTLKPIHNDTKSDDLSADRLLVNYNLAMKAFICDIAFTAVMKHFPEKWISGAEPYLAAFGGWIAHQDLRSSFQ